MEITTGQRAATVFAVLFEAMGKDDSWDPVVSFTEDGAREAIDNTPNHQRMCKRCGTCVVLGNTITAVLDLGVKGEDLGILLVAVGTIGSFEPKNECEEMAAFRRAARAYYSKRAPS